MYVQFQAVSLACVRGSLQTGPLLRKKEKGKEQSCKIKVCLSNIFLSPVSESEPNDFSVSGLLALLLHLWLLGSSLPYETISEKIKMAAATARPIPVVNNVITDEDFEKLRTEGKVRKCLMQRAYLVGKHSEITHCFYSILANLFPSAFSKRTNF